MSYKTLRFQTTKDELLFFLTKKEKEKRRVTIFSKKLGNTYGFRISDKNNYVIEKTAIINLTSWSFKHIDK